MCVYLQACFSLFYCFHINLFIAKKPAIKCQIIVKLLLIPLYWFQALHINVGGVFGAFAGMLQCTHAHIQKQHLTLYVLSAMSSGGQGRKFNMSRNFLFFRCFIGH